MADSTVGVIGAGFVGTAIARGFRRVTDVKVFDSNPKRSEHPFADVAEQDVVFVAVPTPTSSGTGACDLSILDSVMERLYAMQSQGVPVGIVVVKSTVPPGVVLTYSQRYALLRFVSNPEFLTERSADQDFVNPARVVIGTDRYCAAYAYKVGDLYRELLGDNITILYVLHDAAALIKYGSNCFFATKVSFFNELKQICDALDVGFDLVRNGILASGWVDAMHTLVPGPDGHLGFGGKCFPKDTMALARVAKDLGVDPLMLRAALAKNAQVRDVRDWEHIDGAMS